MPQMTIITNAKEIRAAMRQLRAQLKAAAEPRRTHEIGFPGGRDTAGLYVLRAHGIWLSSIGDAPNRYWNGFGHVMPEERGTLPLDVEINVPREGIHRNIGAVFLRGPRGRVLLAHRGRIGGGAKGVGAEAFWGRYDDQAVEVDDGDRASRVVVLGSLGDRRLLDSIADFVMTVAEVKAAVRADKADGADKATTKAPRRAPSREVFVPEFEGTAMRRASAAEAVWHHGAVVRHLEAAVKAAGFGTRNDKHRDLVAGRRGREIVFEVKTEATPQSVYTGVGQLVFGAPRRRRGQTAALVLPEPLPRGLKARLRPEAIEVIGYRWVEERVAFTGLRGVLAAPRA